MSDHDTPHHPRLVAVFQDRNFDRLYVASTLGIAQAFKRGLFAGAELFGGSPAAYILPEEAELLEALIPVDQRSRMAQAPPEAIDLSQTTSRPATSDLPAHLEMLTRGRRTR